ncbi:DEAD/DEAH box helicase [Xanthocytophaga flava]|uniref:DEAD/DEAH box helicase n=1 Tax=Xanthocytophaga flava TaxID=3048013 RepID=UPI0028D23170|nr:DEAD/DEAH box helicase [Xanthocytophaga flavus]MDJ1468385.1 DEAD/DEAH box helicase [Xanthocytophaga flavus]
MTTDLQPITFESFKLNKQLLTAVAEAGYETPTEIQQKAIPIVQGGHDVLGIAQTGTGKTAAYLLPILMKVKYAQGMAPRALILAPTRELVMQIDKAITELGKYTDIRHLGIYGGIGPKTQIETIQKGLDIIVATPGRFMDLYLKGELITKEIRTLVLDEADRMMDMGFMPQIRRILEVIPVKRQNLLFSATFLPRVETLSEEFLEHPVRIEVAPQASTPEVVKQSLYEIPNVKTKAHFLEYLLQNAGLSRVIVFTRTRQTAENIYRFLTRKMQEDEVRVIHANKGQNTRINSMESFKEGNVRVLVATDVAARGIDVQEVSHVINFDVPIVYEDYVHRIGRTGRAFRTGEAITFMNKAEKYHIEKIEKLIRMTIPRETLPAEIEIFKTPFEEDQEMNREIDNQKRRENPDFQGAFHEKKRQKGTNTKPGKKNVKSPGKPRRK